MLLSDSVQFASVSKRLNTVVADQAKRSGSNMKMKKIRAVLNIRGMKAPSLHHGRKKRQKFSLSKKTLVSNNPGPMPA
jgi:hypothetical protein